MAPSDPTEPGAAAESRGLASASVDAVEAMLSALAVLRRRWLVVAVWLALSLAGMAAAISALKPEYRATTTVLIKQAGPAVLDKVQGVNEEQPGQSAYDHYLETQKTVIRSRKVTAAALDRLDLGDDPVLLGVDQIADPIARKRKMSEVDPVERLQKTISVGEVRNSRVVKITAEYPDAQVAADIANAVAAAYLDYVDVSRADTGADAKEKVESERKKASDELKQKEASLDEFKENHAITSISLQDRQNLITQTITLLSAKVSEAKARRIELESLYERAAALENTQSLAAASLLDADQRLMLDELLTERLIARRDFAAADLKYGDKHPEWRRAKERVDAVDANIVEARTQMLSALEAERDAAAATERKLVASLGQEKQRALELGRLEPRYRELEREARTAEEAFGIVARRDAEIGMTNRVERPPVDVLDEATPNHEPVRPRKLLLMAVAGLFGLFGGAVTALAVDARDARIRGLADLQRALSGFGLGVLGQLPVLPPDPTLGVGNVRAQRRQRDLYSFRFPQSMMAERIRGVRSSIQHALGEEGPVVLLVTSPSSAEGKSSTAMNVALSFCQAGRRVCLIDADMRRPRLHQVFPPPVDRKPVGLASVLAREATIDQALQGELEDAPASLEVLVCGPVPEGPAELLESAEARRTIELLKERFDVLVIDSPPVLPVADPLIIARLVDGVVLVARSQATTRTALTRALSQLRERDTNLLGVVLNESRFRGDGYGYGYGSEYYAYRRVETADDSV